MKSSLFTLFVAAVVGTVPAWRATAAEGTTAAPHTAEKAKTKRAAPAAAKPTPAGEVTLKGQLTCAKCGLHESSVCQNVLRVPGAGADSETKYYLAKNDVAEAHHEQVCGGQVSATVTGRVSDDGGKKVLTASAITLQ